MTKSLKRLNAFAAAIIASVLLFWAPLFVGLFFFVQGASAAANCSWNQPGADRYTGKVEDAIRSFKELGAVNQAILIEKWRSRQGQQVTIHRDKITGLEDDGFELSNLRRMHFGSKGAVCDTVDRSGWKEDATQGAIVLFADPLSSVGVVIPAVCTNVSLVTRTPRSFVAAPPPAEEKAAEEPHAATGGGGFHTPASAYAPPAAVAAGALPVAPAATPNNIRPQAPIAPIIYNGSPIYTAPVRVVVIEKLVPMPPPKPGWCQKAGWCKPKPPGGKPVCRPSKGKA